MGAQSSRIWRATAVDSVAFIVIAAVVVLPRLRFIGQAHGFNDSSWYFHYGRRVLQGDVPYRDFVFQVGPLPIYVDAAFQAVFGSCLVASSYAALAIHVLRVFAVWAVARRLAGVPAASLLALFCASDIAFGWAHDWSWSYTQLSTTFSALLVVAAERATTPRRSSLWLALSGFSAGLVVASRQANFVMIAVMLATITVALGARSREDLRRLARVWVGFGAAVLIMLAALAIVDALGPAIQQIFLDAPEKKGVSAIHSIFDAISGGALVIPSTKWGAGLVMYIVVPAATVAIALRLAREHSDATVSARSVGVLLVPGAIGFGLLLRYGHFELNDLVRTFFMGTTMVAILSPQKFARWFGCEPLTGLALTALPLASELGLEMSFPGRGWTDYASLTVGAILFVLASTRVPRKPKVMVCAGMALVGLMHVGWFLHAGRDPFALPGAVDDPVSHAQFTIDGPIFEGVRMNESRQKAVEWLRRQVPSGSTCFLYGTDSALYDVLECHNPTRIDTTIPDFITTRDAEDALTALRTAPPDFIISQETSLENVPLTVEDAHWKLWEDLNQRAGVAMHDGLRTLLTDYDEVGLVGDAIGPSLSAEAATTWDNLQTIRLYRRRK